MHLNDGLKVNKTPYRDLGAKNVTSACTSDLWNMIRGAYTLFMSYHLLMWDKNPSDWAYGDHLTKLAPIFVMFKSDTEAKVRQICWI